MKSAAAAADRKPVGEPAVEPTPKPVLKPVRKPARRLAWARLPLLLLGMLALLGGTWAGLLRLGAVSASATPGWVVQALGLHGPLMVCGFFGVVISLERAVALARPWGWVAPVAAAIGTLMGLTGYWQAAAAAWLLAGLMLLAVTLAVGKRQPEPFVAVLALGAAAWAVGSALWLANAGIAAALPWWLSFLVMTIAGERLELSRLTPRPRHADWSFSAILLAWLGALVFGLWSAAAASHLLGACLLLLALWLARYDLARRTVRQKGLTRFIACSLLAGYFWLAVGGGIALWSGLQPGTPAWDAALHAWMLGFVFSMVFGHAPIIFPAVLRVALPYNPGFYLPLVLLHLAVAARVLGSLAGWEALRAVSGWGAAIALVVFILTMLRAAIGGSANKSRPAQGRDRVQKPG